MRRRSLLAACSGQKSDSQMAALHGSAGGDSLKAQARAATPTGRDVLHSIANAPDRGTLMAYRNQGKPTKREGAFTYYPVNMSEAHALKGVVTGHMTVPMPDGSEVKLNYERHDESIDGNWTWVGRVEGGDPMQEAIITFGEEAVFASIPQGKGKPPLSIRTQGNSLYAVQTDPTKLRSPNVGHEDMALPEASTLRQAVANQVLAAKAQVSQKAVAQAAPPSAVNTIDVAVGYTAGFRTKGTLSHGGATTALAFLFQVANQGFSNSNVNGYLRLVNAQEVSYSDTATSNQLALHELTGSNGTANVAIPAALTPLRTARDQYGADVALLVRGFQQPEHQGCGIAWLIGANGANVDPVQDARWGYGVVSYGDDTGTDGNSYYCEPESMVHEVGHLLGSAHDRANATGAAGRYPYSYGYKNTERNFYTIMAYGDQNQTSYRLFSNPNILTCGQTNPGPCGVANEADNARSLNQTIPVVAQFRATTVPFNNGFDIAYIAKRGASGRTEVHTLTAASVFQTFSAHIATALLQGTADKAANYLFGDYNLDGVADLFLVLKSGTPGKTEVHVLNGTGGYSSFLLHVATPIGTTGSDNQWVYRLGDYNGDGRLDLYAINKMGAGGRTEVHVLNGANAFQTFLLQRSTAAMALGNGYSWGLDVADYNGDGKPDLYLIGKVGSTGRTEVHVLNGANDFQTYLANIGTVLGSTGTDNRWDFKVGDYNKDGIPDLYCLDKAGVSGRTESHVLDGGNAFQTFALHAAMAVGAVGSSPESEFELIPAK